MTNRCPSASSNPKVGATTVVFPAPMIIWWHIECPDVAFDMNRPISATCSTPNQEGEAPEKMFADALSIVSESSGFVICIPGLERWHKDNAAGHNVYKNDPVHELNTAKYVQHRGCTAT